MLFFYGIDTDKINITALVFNTCAKTDGLFIPSGDPQRAELFGDPCPGVVKKIYILKDGSEFIYSDKVSITIDKDFKITTKNYIKSAVVAIAKFEQHYIEHFVNYHLKLGFDSIYIYDNEDTPVYNYLQSDRVIVTHLPGNRYYKAVQYIALEHLIKNFIHRYTHVAHIDIDEYIVLKKHTSINDFINEYINGDCAGIAMNWRYFGSNGHTERSDVPDVYRFTKCQENGNIHIKTLFDVRHYAGWDSPHSVKTQCGYFIKNTKGDHVFGPFNENIDFSVIQVNHYKCKTIPEFQYIRTRGRADLKQNPIENVLADFKLYDLNEIDDYTAALFYSNGDLSKLLGYYVHETIEGHVLPQQIESLKTLVAGKKRILEIGFNAGHSSKFFLEHTDATIVSFDLGCHVYTYYSKKIIDSLFPGRHTLILGDSKNSVKMYPQEIFDLIFIDGGHEYTTAKSDLLNCKKFANQDTLVILDDTVFNSSWEESWTIGPTKVWKESKDKDIILPIDSIDYLPGRGMSWGKFKI
jgi:predicted O-methyltransferase YrrM